VLGVFLKIREVVVLGLRLGLGVGGGEERRREEKRRGGRREEGRRERRG